VAWARWPRIGEDVSDAARCDPTPVPGAGDAATGNTPAAAARSCPRKRMRPSMSSRRACPRSLFISPGLSSAKFRRPSAVLPSWPEIFKRKGTIWKSRHPWQLGFARACFHLMPGDQQMRAHLAPRGPQSSWNETRAPVLDRGAEGPPRAATSWPWLLIDAVHGGVGPPSFLFHMTSPGRGKELR